MRGRPRSRRCLRGRSRSSLKAVRAVGDQGIDRWRWVASMCDREHDTSGSWVRLWTHPSASGIDVDDRHVVLLVSKRARRRTRRTICGQLAVGLTPVNPPKRKKRPARLRLEYLFNSPSFQADRGTEHLDRAVLGLFQRDLTFAESTATSQAPGSPMVTPVQSCAGRLAWPGYLTARSVGAPPARSWALIEV
jgi:hypothetical protein